MNSNVTTILSANKIKILNMNKIYDVTKLVTKHLYLFCYCKS